MKNHDNDSTGVRTCFMGEDFLVNKRRQNHIINKYFFAEL